MLELSSFVATSGDTFRFSLPCCGIRGRTPGALIPEMSLSLDLQCRFTEDNSTTEDGGPINGLEDGTFRTCTNLPSVPPGVLVLQVLYPQVL